MIIDVPAGKDPLTYVWGELVPGIGPAAAAFSAAVYAHSTLPLREFEAARLTIARVNGCLFCLDYRTERDGEKVEGGFFQEISAWRSSSERSGGFILKFVSYSGQAGRSPLPWRPISPRFRPAIAWPIFTPTAIPMRPWRW